MPQFYARIILHTTFSTKYRLPLINPEIEAELHAVLYSALEKQGSTVLKVGGIPDHVHIIHSLPRTKSISELMERAKSISSAWIKTEGHRYRNFAWQDGYASFSVDYRKVDGVIRYVERQKIHHGLAGNGLTYEQEYEKLLRAYGFTDYNKAYLFPDPPEDGYVSEPLPTWRTTDPRRGVSHSVGLRTAGSALRFR